MPRNTATAYETENSIFAKRLTAAMKERGETQTSLAEKITLRYITIQRQTISLYMNGQSKPDTERLTAIARVLDVSSDWLLGLSDDKEMSSKFPAVNQMISEYSAALNTLANEAQQKEVFELMFHSNGICSFFPECIEDAWRPAVTRCKVVLAHLEAFFDDENKIYNGSEILRILTGR